MGNIILYFLLYST